MTYIYDIILNWSEINILYDFYEWDKKDNLEHIKRMPLIKISEKTFTDFLTHEITIEKSFLNKIKDLTEVYRNKKIEPISYACSLSDGERVIATEWNQKGKMIYHSKLLLDEEEDVLDLSKRLNITEMKYITNKKIVIDYSLTRKEQEIKRYIVSELDNAFRNKKEEKISYLYQEYFDEIGNSFEEMYQSLKTSINHFSEKHKKIFDLLKLSHIKKKV